MPAEHALARNPNIRDEELKAAIDYLCAKIRRAAHKGKLCHSTPIDRS